MNTDLPWLAVLDRIATVTTNDQVRVLAKCLWDIIGNVEDPKVIEILEAYELSLMRTLTERTR